MGNSRAQSETGKNLEPDPPDPRNDDESNDSDAHLSFTRADPIGVIPIGEAKDNAALGAKIGLKEGNVSLKDLTPAFFHNSMEQKGC
jgi:hypothetical protein